MNECLYCDAFEKGYFEFEKSHNIPSEIDLKNRILYETDNFVVFPTIGQITEGYLLIASKKHFLGVGQIPQDLYPELETVCEKVKQVLSANYSTPLFFEHGSASEVKKGGCCIVHAHLHVVPAQMNILPELAKHFKYKKIKSFDSLKKQFENGAPYFYYESNLGEKYLIDVPEVVPSQYIRQVIAVKIGKAERWDWKKYLGIDELISTTNKLKGKFN